MAGGSQRFYDALHGNPLIEFQPCSLTHALDVIADIDGFCAINSVLQVDLLGRANAERIDGKIVAAPGGLPDFARGAAMAKHGMSLIALRSTSKDGMRSNIVPALPADSPVTVGPEGIDYVVTEYGAARLRGLSSADRRHALIAIAHPEFRGDLRREAQSPEFAG